MCLRGYFVRVAVCVISFCAGACVIEAVSGCLCVRVRVFSGACDRLRMWAWVFAFLFVVVRGGVRVCERTCVIAYVCNRLRVCVCVLVCA
jgi:hypothetical protein